MSDLDVVTEEPTVLMGTVALSDLLSQALGAFTSDVSYAVAIARSAVTIESKRTMWKLRNELKESEQQARKMCSAGGSFFCVNPSPCGTGQCPFAQGDLSLLVVPRHKGTTRRPQPSMYDEYSIDRAVIPLRDLRAAS